GAVRVQARLEGLHGAAAGTLAELRLAGRGRDGPAGGRALAQGGPGQGADDTVHAQTCGGLRCVHRTQRRGAEDTIDLQAGALGVELLLEVAHGGAASALAQLDGGVGGGGREDRGRGSADGAGGGGGRSLRRGRGAAGEGCGGRDGADDGDASDPTTHRGGEPAIVDHGTA